MTTNEFFAIPPAERANYFYVCRNEKRIAFVCPFSELPVDDPSAVIMAYFSSEDTALRLVSRLNAPVINP